MKTAKIQKQASLPLTESALYEGDALTVLQRLPSDSIQCAVTSPPYWGLRDYNNPGQIGLEETLPQFINRLRTVFAELRRVLRPDGVFWLNIGDGYTSGNRGWRAPDKKNPARAMDVRPGTPDGLKSKDLLGIPWRLAFALQDDGWYLRADVVWNKPNAMPESVKDRPTRATSCWTRSLGRGLWGWSLKAWNAGMSASNSIPNMFPSQPGALAWKSQKS